MLYLFNSAYRPRYIDNVLNTMHLPFGAENMYQYPENLIEKCLIEEPCKKINKQLKNEDVLIIFIDREAPDKYRFIPLRKGKFLKVEMSASVYYFDVQLNEVCSVDDVLAFSNSFKQQMKELTFNVSTDDVRTGFFAFYHQKMPEYQITFGDDSWRRTCNELAKCAKMQVVFPIFTRFNMYDSKEKLLKVRKHSDTSSKYRLKMGNTYYAKIDYFIASPELNPETTYVQLSIDVNPRKVSDEMQTQVLGAEAGRATYKFITEAISPNVALRYNISESSNKEKTVKVATSSIRFNVVRKPQTAFAILFFFFVLLASNIIVALPISTILDPINSHVYLGAESSFYERVIYGLASILKRFSLVYPAIVGLISSGATYILVRLYTKKEIT